MALVVTDEVTQEAKNILAASNAFEVLGISPAEFSPALVKLKHEEKVQKLKRFFRNKNAALARNRVDEAKVRLLDDRLREKELQGISLRVQQEAAEREELRRLEDWTRHLEVRASVIKQRNELRIASGMGTSTDRNTSSSGSIDGCGNTLLIKTMEETAVGVKRTREE